MTVAPGSSPRSTPHHTTQPTWPRAAIYLASRCHLFGLALPFIPTTGVAAHFLPQKPPIVHQQPEDQGQSALPAFAHAAGLTATGGLACGQRNKPSTGKPTNSRPFGCQNHTEALPPLGKLCPFIGKPISGNLIRTIRLPKTT